MKVFKNASKKRKVLESYDALLAGWKVEHTERDIMTEYGSTHIIEAGDQKAPDLMLFHGVGDNSAVMWLPNIGALSQHFHCIAVDTIGGPGKSVPNQMYETEFDQEAWISEMIQKVCGGNIPHLAGISNGAYMAYNYTTVYPERVGKCVCIEGGIVADPVKAMMSTLKLLLPEILLPIRSNMMRIMTKLTHPESDVLTRYPELIDHMILAMKSHHRKAMFNHDIKDYNKEEGQNVKEKLLFILGDLDILERKSFINLLETGGYTYRIIRKAGHAVNFEQADKVNNEIIRFLKVPE